MRKLSERTSLPAALVLLGAASLYAQGSFILGVEAWIDSGSAVPAGGPWSGVTVTETEANDDYTTANAIAVGDDFAAAIATGGTDSDYVAFTVAANDSIIAKTVETGGIADTQMWLYDTDGVTQLAYNHNIGAPNYMSLISYSFSTAGTYYLRVGPYSANDEGTYTLELRSDSGTFDVAGSWVYIKKALEAVAPGVTRAGVDGSVAVLGSTDSSSTQHDAGAAYHHSVPLAAASTSLSGVVSYHDTAASLATFFTDLVAGTVNPSIIVFTAGGSGNDMDASEAAELVNHAATIASYLSSGGGLISHGDEFMDSTTGSYTWLPLVFPGAAVEQDSNPATLTNEGKFLLPRMADADHDAYADGWFTGHGLDVYMTSPGGWGQGPWSGVTVTETEVNNHFTAANAVAPGDDYAGAIDTSGSDVDYAAFTVNAGETLFFETVDVGGMVDSVLYLYDTDGTTLLDYNDDGGVGLLSWMMYSFTAPGTYYIAVEPWSSMYDGAYSLQIRVRTPFPDHDVIIGSLPSAWTWLGHDLAGVSGKPLAIPTGELRAGSAWTLSLTNAAPSRAAFLILGISTVYANFKGGVLVPATQAILPLSTNASGELLLGGNLGAPPSGASFYLQYWIVDAAAPVGYAASNSFSGTTP